MTHGTIRAYSHDRCRCEDCTRAMRDYQRDYQRARRERGGALPGDGAEMQQDQEALRDLLVELFPDGLTAECPARRGQVAA